MTPMRWSIPENVLSSSVAIMQPHGARGNEGLALWMGRTHNNCAVISHVIDVFGPGFRTTPLHLSLSMRAMSVLTDLADHFGVYLVGQIHSHPSQLLDLSRLDIQQGIRIPNYLSVVCPYYAQRLPKGFTECGVHVFERTTYRRLASSEIAARVHIQAGDATILRCEVPA